jgi:hypothetical protein
METDRALSPLHRGRDVADAVAQGWPSAPIWKLAEAEARGDLTEMHSHLDPDKVKYVHR